MKICEKEETSFNKEKINERDKSNKQSKQKNKNLKESLNEKEKTNHSKMRGPKKLFKSIENFPVYTVEKEIFFLIEKIFFSNPEKLIDGLFEQPIIN
jgi:ribosomal protein L9